MGIFYSTQACSALSHGEHDQMGMRGSEASLDFIQSKQTFPRNQLASLDFVQSGEAFSGISPETPVLRWIKSTVNRGFPVSRSGDWIKSNIG
ncbi:hypothetical protein [Cohnella algarum]|uniref:hypothetical protein n=1 Tax=Cohnella algarum TaxID=2044859 RepID=UPI0019681158|nr:hypothetical protein [Cohnella algarum]MBN2980947.1 hypothetical protein [Cohnella algarum]